jgi:U-box domain
MDTTIDCIPGIGSIHLDIFHRAGFVTVRDLHTFDRDDHRLQSAINTLKQLRPGFDNSYWRRLFTKCINAIIRVRSGVVNPFAYFMCPISLEIMEDPVVTPTGQTYDRQYIYDWLDVNPTDPLSRQPLTKEQLYPVHSLKVAIAHYKNTYMNIII